MPPAQTPDPTATPNPAPNPTPQSPASDAPASPPAPAPASTPSPVAAPSAAPKSGLMKLYYGRLGRLGYLLGVLYLILIWTGISLVEVAILGAVSGGSFTSSAAGGQVANGLSVFMFILIGVSMVVLFIFSYGLQARRWHDLNCSGWFSLVGLVPVLGIVTLLLLFIPGTNGSNRFGEPYQGGHGLRPVLGL